MTISIRALLRPAKIMSSLGLVAFVAACGAPVTELQSPQEAADNVLVNGVPFSEIDPDYGVVEDGGYTLPPVPSEYLTGVNRRELVQYPGFETPGTIEIDPHAKFLYWVMADGMAWRYPIAVGREGRGISGDLVIGREAEWPSWTPTQNMIRTEPEVYSAFAGGVPGGLSNPLGARALYLYRGGRDTYYRVHGTNDLGSIGNSGSAGCIRMFNQDVIDLYNRVPVGADVAIRTYEDSVRIEGEALANRGVELPAVLPTAEQIANAR